MEIINPAKYIGPEETGEFQMNLFPQALPLFVTCPDRDPSSVLSFWLQGEGLWPSRGNKAGAHVSRGDATEVPGSLLISPGEEPRVEREGQMVIRVQALRTEIGQRALRVLITNSSSAPVVAASGVIARRVNPMVGGKLFMYELELDRSAGAKGASCIVECKKNDRITLKTGNSAPFGRIVHCGDTVDFRNPGGSHRISIPQGRPFVLPQDLGSDFLGDSLAFYPRVRITVQSVDSPRTRIEISDLGNDSGTLVRL